MRKLKSKNNFSYKISKYLPVFVILLAISIMVGSTFAYFTDRKDEESGLTFSKVELSSETTTGINGSLRDVIPGTPLVDGALKFSKSIDSEPIYVRAKISFSLPSEYKEDEDMKEMVDVLRSATDFNIKADEQHGAVWSAKDGNYFYLMEVANEGVPINLKRVETIDTYVLSDEVVVPRDLESLPNNAQYMKSINFHIAFEAIQADNVSSVLSETKETFNTLFPESESEKVELEEIIPDDENKTSITLYDENGQVYDMVEINDTFEYIEYKPVDNSYSFLGWYTDESLTNEYLYSDKLESGSALYPKVAKASDPNLFNFDNGVITGYVGNESDIVIPSSYSIDGVKTSQVKMTFGNEFELYEYLQTLSDESSITIQGIQMNRYTDLYELSNFRYPVNYEGQTTTPNYVYGDDIQVVEVGSSSFNGNTTIKNVTLPSSVSVIGLHSFQYCTNLEYITFSNRVSELPMLAFGNCTSLALTSLPDGVRSIASTFDGCTSLALTHLPSELEELFGAAFNNCTNLAITSMPSGLTNCDARVFDGCNQLPNNGSLKYLNIEGTENNCIVGMVSKSATSVDFSGIDNITRIASWTFNGGKFTSINIPDSVIKFGGYLFYNSSLQSFTIPTTINEIPDNMLYNSKSLTSVTISDNITKIGQSAFSGCTSLQSINIPSSVKFIDAFAFYGCTSLLSIRLPNGLESIKKGVFSGCTSLASISLPSDLKLIENQAFYNCTSLNLTSLPSGVTSIGELAFYECTSLAPTSLSSDLTSIGERAFYGCTSLALTNLPSGVTSIGERAFYGCTSLALTSLPSGLDVIKYQTFYNCTSLNLNNLPRAITNIVSEAFYGCTNLPSNNTISYLPIESTNSYAVILAKNTSITTVDWPNNVTIIACQAFQGCSSLALTSLPSSITYIGNSAFQGCSSLALTSLPSDLISIGSKAFYNCTNLGLTSLPSGVKTIGDSAFYGCTNLPSNDSVYYLPIEGTSNNVVIKAKSTGITSVDWPENVTMIAGGAFTSCSRLSLTELPSSVTYIGENSFYNCSNLALTSLPSDVISIGNYAFYNCSSLALTSLPSGITSIGNHAFRYCSNLALTSLPSDVISIGDYAFLDCSKLVLTDLPSGVTYIGAGAFNGCTKLALTILPSSVTSIGESAFKDCTNLALIELPSNVISVDSNAFDGCTNLNYILCESDAVATLVKGKGRDNTYIYSLQESGYAVGTSETAVVVNDNVTIYTTKVDGEKWVRTSDNKYFRCIA